MESIVRPTPTKPPVQIPHNVLLGIEIAKQWNKLSDQLTTDMAPSARLTPVRSIEATQDTPDLRQPRTPFSNFRLLRKTREPQQVYTNIAAVKDDVFQQTSPPFQVLVWN